MARLALAAYDDDMRVSVIIPTYEEAAIIADTVRAVRACDPGEIIAVDGGSTDGTTTAACAADVVLSSPRGRAAQMNAGAARARGDVLLFLHADCRLDANALAHAAKSLR